MGFAIEIIVCFERRRKDKDSYKILCFREYMNKTVIY